VSVAAGKHRPDSRLNGSLFETVGRDLRARLNARRAFALAEVAFARHVI
jgi:hypothetical protein